MKIVQTERIEIELEQKNQIVSKSVKIALKKT